MKKTLLTLIGIIGISSMVFAQQEELKSASANLEKKDYIAALDDIAAAKKKVDGLMKAQLAAVLPATFGEFEMSKEDGESFMGGSGIGLYKSYKLPKVETTDSEETEDAADPAASMMNMGLEPTLIVEISTDMMNASEVMNAHSNSEGGGDPNITAFRVKGYRAIARKEPSYGGDESEGQEQPIREEAHAIVGGAFVKVMAEGLEEEGKAKAFLEQIDFEKLVGIVGK